MHIAKRITYTSNGESGSGLGGSLPFGWTSEARIRVGFIAVSCNRFA